MAHAFWSAPQTCLKCGYEMDAFSATKDEACRPKPGDPVLCLRCGSAATVDEQGRLRGFTDAEFEALLADPETLKEMNRTSLAIKLSPRDAELTRIATEAARVD
jgi:hypothetical protein